MLVCITREWMLETLKDKEKMNQWYPAVRHQAILGAVELKDPGVLLIYVLYLISHSLMSSKMQICLMALTFKMKTHNLSLLCALQFLVPN